MTKVYACPKELEEDLTKFDWEKDWDEQEKEAHEQIRQYCKAHTKSKSPLVGVVFRVPCADSHAQYMVFNTNPLELIHIPFGDGWDAPEYQTRGIRLADIQAQVEFDENMKELARNSS